MFTVVLTHIARPELMFFELNKMDPLGRNPWKRSYEHEMTGTFAGDQEVLAQLIAELDPGASFRGENGQQSARLEVLMANATHDADTSRLAASSLGEIVEKVLMPDG